DGHALLCRTGPHASLEVGVGRIEGNLRQCRAEAERQRACRDNQAQSRCGTISENEGSYAVHEKLSCQWRLLRPIVGCRNKVVLYNMIIMLNLFFGQARKV